MDRVRERLAADKVVLCEIEDTIQKELCECRQCEPLLEEARRLLEDEKLVGEMEVENTTYYMDMFKAKIKIILEKIHEYRINNH